ncbi:MAG: hypothetical protein GX351_01220 [Peptococcaceae bacterium]|nr:hypothetical protein [Peptococcaceae bacterium]
MLKYVLADIIEHKQKIIREMSRANKESVKTQADSLRQEIQIMEVVLKWLFQ